MAMMSTGGAGYRSYSYTVSETYTLEEAVGRAATGSISPNDVFRQLPSELQKEVDRLSSARYARPFSKLTHSETQVVMGDLQQEIKRAKEEREKPITIFQALQWAIQGKVDDSKVFEALPQQLRDALDGLATSLGSPNFGSANREVRVHALEILVQALEQQGTGPSSTEDARGLDLHNRALELHAKGETALALEAMRNAESILASQAASETLPTPALLGVLCNLSSARAHVGDWTADATSLKSAIESATRGLALNEELQDTTSFNRAVLLHNRGHAGSRMGEINQDRGTVERAITDIDAARQIFIALQRTDAVEENAGLRKRADAILEKLASGRRGWLFRSLARGR
jgi:hypothetical protein